MPSINPTNKAALHYFRQHPSLVVPPLFIRLLFLGLFFLLIKPLLQMAQHHPVANYIIQFAKATDSLSTTGLFVTILLLFLVLNIISQFVSSICSYICYCQLRGEKSPYKKAFKRAFKSSLPILMWAFTRGTLGLAIYITRYFPSDFQIRLAVQRHYRWNIATFFAPILLMQGVKSPRQILHQSMQRLDCWGAHVRPRFGFSLHYYLLLVLSMLPFIISLQFNGNQPLIIGAAISMPLYLLIQSSGFACHYIFVAALYAKTQNETIDYFDEQALTQAFKSRN